MVRVACVILTYNRLPLLQRCIESVRNQSYKNFDIWVVDNASSDGTFAWLSQQNDLFTLSIALNEGAANGFNIGLKSAYDKGYDWIWILDDDGVADREQLGKLLNGTLKYGFLFTNALVCDINDPYLLAFGLAGHHKVREAQQEEYIMNAINPFNGTFIHRSVIDKIGYIEKSMYLYGCEVEYQYRAIKRQIHVATITSAVHYHHRTVGEFKNIIPFYSRFRIVLLSSDKAPYYYRNMGYIHREYRDIISWREKMLPWAICFYFLRVFNLKELKIFVKRYIMGVSRGLDNNFRF